MNKIIKKLLFKGLALGLLSGYAIAAATCYTHQYVHEHDCYSGTNPTPPTVDNGWNCELHSTEELPSASDLSVALTNGYEYITETKCTLTWRCTKVGESTKDMTTNEDIDNENNQKRGAPCDNS